MLKYTKLADVSTQVLLLLTALIALAFKEGQMLFLMAVLFLGTYQLISALAHLFVRRNKMRLVYFIALFVVGLFYLPVILYETQTADIFNHTGFLNFLLIIAKILTGFIAFYYLFVSYKEYRDYYTVA